MLAQQPTHRPPRPSTGAAAARGAEPQRLPPAVWRILGTELGERFSYYSLRAVLALYFLSIGFTEAEAVSLFSYTAGLAYFMPLLGGALADVLWGRYKTILVFSLIYIAGCVSLALNAASGGGATGALLALALISVGTGGIKPCVSSFGADQLEEGDEAARSRYFGSFYLAINCGSMLSFVAAPLLRTSLGFPAVFAASALVLSAAVVIFASGRAGYRQPPPASSFYKEVAAQAWQQLQLQLRRLQGRGGYKQLRRLLPTLLAMPCFWALFEQQGSAWLLQARGMQRAGLLPFGWEVSPEMLLIFNPVFVTILVPAAARLFERWPKLFGGQRPPTAVQKMCCGMLAASLAFLCSAALQLWLDAAPAASVPVLWQVPQIFLLTVAEVLVSVVSLDYFYAQAPAEAKAAVSALQCLTVSAGAVLCGLLYQLLSPHLRAAELLLAFAALMAANAAAFFLASRGGGAPAAR